jgi:hypothetical protein
MKATFIEGKPGVFRTETRTRYVEVAPATTDRYRLELSPEEATFLLDLTCRIGGDPETSRRGIADRLRTALRAAGAHESNRDDITEHLGGIHFGDRRA